MSKNLLLSTMKHVLALISVLKLNLFSSQGMIFDVAELAIIHRVVNNYYRLMKS